MRVTNKDIEKKLEKLYKLTMELEINLLFDISEEDILRYEDLTESVAKLNRSIFETINERKV